MPEKKSIMLLDTVPLAKSGNRIESILIFRSRAINKIVSDFGLLMQFSKSIIVRTLIFSFSASFLWVYPAAIRFLFASAANASNTLWIVTHLYYILV